MLSSLYGAIALARRRSFEADPARRLRLARPVISVGNLSAGGRGKTPLAAAIAGFLRDQGEVPAILSRGYAREHPEDGVVVVRDPSGIRADLARAGDEPLMLARRLDGVAVLSCADRYLAGRLAEVHLGATIHVLDDGFQHLRLHRDVDLVAVAREDLEGDRTFPSGRLREPVAALDAADALIAVDEQPRGTRFRASVFSARRTLGMAQLIDPPGATIEPTAGAVVAVAGIARPDRFFEDLRQAGWPISRTVRYRDHHPYSAADVKHLMRAAQQDAAGLVVTTEKDAVRLLPYRPFPVQVAFVPLEVVVEPADAFQVWLLDRVRDARRGMA